MDSRGVFKRFQKSSWIFNISHRMYTYIHACMHTYIHTYTHTYIHTSMQTDRQTQGKYVGICSMCLSFSHFQSACSPFFTSKPRFGRVNFVLKPPLSGYLFKHKLPNTSLNVILRSCHPWSSTSHEVQDRNDPAGLICRACESGFFSVQLEDDKGTTHATRHCLRVFGSRHWCVLHVF